MIRRSVAHRPAPLIRGGNLRRIGGRGENLRDQRIRIERDGSDKLLELLRVKWLGRLSGRLAVVVRAAGLRLVICLLAVGRLLSLLVIGLLVVRLLSVSLVAVALLLLRVRLLLPIRLRVALLPVAGRRRVLR